MLTLIDKLLNKITMYRLVLYYLCALWGVALIFGIVGVLPYKPLALIFSTAILIGICWIANKLFADAYKTHANVESVYITALILALIITPVGFTDLAGISFLFWAAILAMASKYILAFNKKHFFNPAAIAVVITAFALNQYASWWVGGNIPMMIFVILGGLLVTRKTQRFDLVLAFFGAAMVSIVATASSGSPLEVLQKAFLHAPLFFFAFVMLTEPLTTPPTRSLRISYGLVVGFLFAPGIHIGSVYSTPELALVVGNIFSYCVSPNKAKYVFTLKEKNEIGADIYDFTLVTESKVKFQPGQYMEWTLGHKNSDSRGNRRYFTVASSPSEREVRLGVKFYDQSSSFKKRMLAMQPGDEIMGGQVAGDFLLPEDQGKKLAFIAGGIGITPFRSMVKYLIDRPNNEGQRSIVMLYSNRQTSEICYQDIFEDARKKLGMRTVYAITGANQALPEQYATRGQVDTAMVKREIPDYRERIFYISGTRAMVSYCEKMLHQLGVPRSQIKTDFFPGFV